MGQPLVPMYYGLLLGGIHFQPVPIYTLDELEVLTCYLTVANVQKIGANDASNMANKLGAWEVLHLMPQVRIPLINEGAISHDTICKML